MLRSIILIIEAVLFFVMLFFGKNFLHDKNSALLVIFLALSLPLIEYFRRFLPDRVEGKSKAIRVRDQELRQRLNNHIMKCREDNLSKEVIIKDIAGGEGTLSHFKGSLEETNKSGIHIGLGAALLSPASYSYRLPNLKKGETGEVEAMLMAEIPFDIIERVDIKGDQKDPHPHIFCRYPFNNKPYNRLFYVKVIIMENGIPWYKEIADYEVVKLNSNVEKDW